jgi:type IV/VI secretion system ImpK/VasF family protein
MKKKEQIDMQCNLIENSRDLLYLIVLLRENKHIISNDLLLQISVKEINHFTDVLKSISFPEEQIKQAAYLVCAALDEASSIRNTGMANHRSLINHYYGEECSGENFFNILDKLYDDEIDNFALIKLSYLLICFGFVGKYGMDRSKLGELNKKKNKALTFIRGQSGKKPLFVSDIQTRPQLFNITWFKVRVFSGCSVALLYIYFLYSLNTKTAQLHKLIINYFS